MKTQIIPNGDPSSFFDESVVRGLGRHMELMEIRNAGWPLPGPVWSCLGASDRSYLAMVLKGERTPGFYESRLRALAFTGSDLVVDAGCGIGQWSISAARYNGSVIGVDVNSTRLLVAASLAGAVGLNNARFIYGSMEHLPVADATADLVLCQGAIMFADARAAFLEFGRILRPGGRLYCNANAVGWYAHLLIDRGLRSGEPHFVKESLRAIARTVGRRDRFRVASRGWLRRSIEGAGFRIHAIGSEGELRCDDAVTAPVPIYASTMYGLPSVLEVVAVRT